MTDQELLESAARAVGISGTYVRMHQAFGDQWVDGIDTGALIYWNPMGNDGDALRLAVKLGIHIAFVAVDSYTGYPNVARARHFDFGEIDEHFDDNKSECGATRRAIVRGAAALGKMASLGG